MDNLRGDAQGNVINGRGGDDELWGGSGKDLFILAAGKGTDTIMDFVKGEDSLGLASGLTFKQLTIARNDSAVEVSITDTGEILA